MLHKAIMWIAALASIVGIALFLIEKFGKNEGKEFSPYLTWGLIVGGVLLGVIFALTDKSEPADKNKAVNQENISENSGIIIGKVDSVGGNFTIEQGDLSTSATKRYLDAMQMVKEEANQNFLSLGFLLKSLESHPPKEFWDKRRPNETEAAFQDRSKMFQKNYLDELREFIRRFPMSRETYVSYQRDLSHKPKVALSIKESYDHQQKIGVLVNDFIEGMEKNLPYASSDTELVAKHQSLFEEKLVSAKIAFCQAGAKYVLTLDEPNEVELFKEYIGATGIGLTKETPKEIWQELNGTIATLYEQKSTILGKRVSLQQSAVQREIDRIIKDPYLIMLRKTMGMTEELSEGELFAMKNKKLNQEEDDPQELLSLAAISFIESDGRAAEFYFKKALTVPKLSELQSLFISLSLERVQHPDLYEGSIGVMIFHVAEDGAAAAAGLRQGDVIYKLNGELVYEPGDISSVLGKTLDGDANLFELRRDGMIRRIAITGGKALDCRSTQLVMLNAVQL